MEARAGVQQRPQAVDERILQIERDPALTDRLLSQAPPAVLASLAADANRMRNRVDEDEAIASAIGDVRGPSVRHTGGPRAFRPPLVVRPDAGAYLPRCPCRAPSSS